jgi:hypothetical protein
MHEGLCFHAMLAAAGTRLSGRRRRCSEPCWSVRKAMRLLSSPDRQNFCNRHSRLVDLC